MKLTCEDYDQLCVVAMRGDLTDEDSDRFRNAMDERMGKDIRDFVLNVAEVEAIDSRGVESLLWLQDQSAEMLGQVRLAGATPTLMEVLRVTRLSGRFDCHENVDAAIASLR